MMPMKHGQGMKICAFSDCTDDDDDDDLYWYTIL